MTEFEENIGVIGLAVMGQNLVLNLLDHNFNIVIFNRTISKVDDFMKNWTGEGKGTPTPTYSLQELVSKLSKPRKILLMIQAGAPIDALLEEISPLLSSGDIIIDGGNSHYTDTQRREKLLKESKIHYIGCGISGGEQGARHGPAMMPGGPFSAWEEVKNILQAISAKGPRGAPCCKWMGPEAAGHFVKMVHNGIEYADMQMISEIFHVTKVLLKKDVKEIGAMFSGWNASSDLSSYLIEITSEILNFNDHTSSIPLVSRIRDTAGQKGTGKWTVEAALDTGSPGTLFAEAVCARSLSSAKEDRLKASLRYKSNQKLEGDEKRKEMSLEEGEILGDALLAAKIIAYSQGFSLLMKASKKYNWNLSGRTIAQVWQGGCIIRSKLLLIIEDLEDEEFGNLVLSDWASKRLLKLLPSLRKVVQWCIGGGIPAPALSAAVAYFDGLISAYLPGAALIQAQRDYFGAHQYELEDSPGTFHHTDWTGCGGKILSSTYQV